MIEPTGNPRELPATAGSACSDQLGAIIGKWPGDETNEQILEALEGLNPEKALRKALEIAWGAMCERRGYAEGWEWKYGREWDEEDEKVKRALGSA